jgi:uncharacterized protein (DUF362 family)
MDQPRFRLPGVKRVFPRRTFLKLILGALASAPAWTRRAHASGHQVGVGRNPDPYTATIRAVDASENWPESRIAGRTVVIKPNLVAPRPAESGVTTDPQVVRALVDRALDSGATRVIIAESMLSPTTFAECGYDIFEDYDADGRVNLIRLEDVVSIPTPVPGGLAMRWIYMPEFLLGDDVVFISVGKMKCHAESNVTLSIKNIFGLPPINRYVVPEQFIGRPRFRLHDRGVQQMILNMLIARPIDYAVVDGIWAMEGAGPIQGTAVRMDLVLAGANPVAVDRTALDAMGLPQNWAPHITYATLHGLGPASLSEVDIRGDGYVTRAFVRPPVPPVVWIPQADPPMFSTGIGQQTAITYSVASRCQTLVEIVRVSDFQPSLEEVRLLRNWQIRPGGTETLLWNGRDNAGRFVPPGVYTIRVQARNNALSMISYATGQVLVNG